MANSPPEPRFDCFTRMLRFTQLFSLCTMVVFIFYSLAEFPNEEEADASVPIQAEDMVEDDVSSRYSYFNKKLKFFSFRGKRKPVTFFWFSSGFDWSLYDEAI